MRRRGDIPGQVPGDGARRLEGSARGERDVLHRRERDIKGRRLRRRQWTTAANRHIREHAGIVTKLAMEDDDDETLSL
jgi:hypothetical protein